MTDPARSDSRRRLPSVDRLLADAGIARLSSLYGREPVRVQVREVLEQLREHLVGRPPASDEVLDGLLGEIPARVAAGLETRLGPRLRRVINATGIFIHTNLGRSPLPPEVAALLPALLSGYCDLELDLESGQRGERNRRVDRLLCEVTGAEAGLVVNNNAAALVLVLAALARDREVVVSRGELVEIGGSFRVPEIMAAAGARLVEVGTTNRTHPRDYEAAIGPETALLLKVHPSNYRLTGFVAAVGGAELARIGHRHGVAVLVDEGSGLLRPKEAPQLADHPSVSELVTAGCDLVCGSGDKLLGGPQAGIIAGRRELVSTCRRHPLYRALRPDRFTFAALEEVLRLHLARRPLPLDRMWPDPGEHRRRLEKVAGELAAEIVAADGYLGGGSAPEAPLPGEALSLPGGEELLARLRMGDPPVVGYVREGRLLLDLRTVDPEEDEVLVRAVRSARVEAGPAGPAGASG